MQGIKKFYFSRFTKINKKKELPDLIDRSGIKIIFPFYHVVSNNDLPHIKNLYRFKNIVEFNEDLDFLQKYYKPLSITDFTNGNYNKEENYFVLSFDDGLKEMYEIVAPILKRRGIPAIFFINSDFVDNKELFYRYKISLIFEQLNDKDKLIAIKKILADKSSNKDELAQINENTFSEFLIKHKPYMTIQQLKNLEYDGFTIGAHSTNHPIFKDISVEDQKLNAAESLKYIKDNFSQKNNYFAFPFTADGVSKDVFDSIYNDMQVQLTFGTSGIKNKISSKHINRIPMEVDKYTADEIIKNEYAYYLIKKIIGKK